MELNKWKKLTDSLKAKLKGKNRHQPYTKIYSSLNHDEAGEITDPRPVTVDVGLKRPKSLQEQVREMIKNENFIKGLEQQGIESIKEANDFDVDDEEVITSPYEVSEQPMQEELLEPISDNGEPDEPVQTSTEEPNNIPADGNISADPAPAS